MAEIKGFAIRGLLKYVKESGYLGGIPAMLNELPADISAQFKEPILGSRWYPYNQFIALLTTLKKELGPGEPQFLEAWASLPATRMPDRSSASSPPFPRSHD